MIVIKKIDHIVLRTERPDAMIAFYCGTLGCAVERQLPDIGITQLRAGECLIDIVAVDSEIGRMGGGAPSASGNNLDHFCLQLEAFDENELSAFLKGRGVELGEFVNRYGAQGTGRSLYIKDTDGNTIELKAIQAS
ncbi:MAG: VOC family protein [Candidatus Nitrohelix vancouverensis]|uniref:VOC family protein n=1 Tax=Candidatus Nitrohelix vancouverensis TaxID=2705534 RepID=A0A7T0C542_9BACT|nr:MAG: VOC family protein [Candidatus Nitrohelix vancouverensis]